MPAKEPTGTTVEASDIFIEGAPEVWFGGVAQYSPDEDGFYHGITGTVDDPVYKLGCFENFRFGESVTLNEIRCDASGLAKTAQDRDYLMVTFDLKTLLPLSTLTHIIRGGDVTVNAAESSEKMGLGRIDNTVFYKFFFSRVYDVAADDWVSVTGHRCQFTGNFQIATPYAQAWVVTGIEVRMYSDSALPTDQSFATVIRVDDSEL